MQVTESCTGSLESAHGLGTEAAQVQSASPCVAVSRLVLQLPGRLRQTGAASRPPASKAQHGRGHGCRAFEPGDLPRKAARPVEEEVRFTRALMAKVAVDVVALAATQASDLQHTAASASPSLPRPDHMTGLLPMTWRQLPLHQPILGFQSGRLRLRLHRKQQCQGHQPRAGLLAAPRPVCLSACQARASPLKAGQQAQRVAWAHLTQPQSMRRSRLPGQADKASARRVAACRLLLSSG